MDAVKYVKEQYRMCRYKLGCAHCPISNRKTDTNTSYTAWIYRYPEQAVEIVEKWSAEHPRKTMMQDFFEKFPKAPREENGVPRPCPSSCGYVEEDGCPIYDSSRTMTCLECWSRPLKE